MGGQWGNSGDHTLKVANVLSAGLSLLPGRTYHSSEVRPDPGASKRTGIAPSTLDLLLFEGC